MGSKKKYKADGSIPTAVPANELEAGVPSSAPEFEPDGEADQEAAPERLDRPWVWWSLEALGVFMLAFAFFSHLQTLTKWVVAVDSFFHQKMAFLIREHGPVKDFYWTTTSVFKDHFSDSSFLYHLSLIPFTFIPDETVAIKLGAVFYDAVLFTIFYLILRVNRVRMPFFFVLVLASCGSMFLYRLCQNRGYLLSIPLAMLTVEACLNRRYKLLGACAIAYPLSYTAFQVVIVIPILHNIAQFLNGERIDKRLPLIALGGSCIGLLIHPNFPQDLYLWWIQNVLVMFFKWTSDVQLFFGGELYPPELKYLTHSTTALFITILITSVATAFSTRRRQTSTLTLFLVTLFFGLLTIASKRFVEYSAPFAVLYAGFLTRDLISDEDVDRWSSRRPFVFIGAVWIIMAVVGGLLFHSYRDVAKDLANEPEPGLKEAAAYLKEHAKKNDIVYTADWDDFPQLWFYNSDQRYMICLDPMFFYMYDKDLWQLWFDTSNVRTQDVYNNIRLRFHAKWVLVTNDFGNLIKKCNSDPRFKKGFSDKDVTVYQVLDELPYFITQWSLTEAYANDRMLQTEPMVLAQLARPGSPVPPAGGVAPGLDWKTWPGEEKGSFLDLERYLTTKEQQHAYAACRVTSPVDQDAELRVGYDDAVTVWLDGKVVIDEKGPAEVVLDGKRVTLKLPKGTSTICVRSTNYKGNWGFMARLVPAKTDLKITPFAEPEGK